MHCSKLYTTILEIELVSAWELSWNLEYAMEFSLELAMDFGLELKLEFEVRERDAFSNFILRIYIARVSKEIFSRLGLKLEFYFKMNMNLGSLAFRGSVTASRLEDENSNNTVTDATTSRKCLDPVQPDRLA